MDLSTRDTRRRLALLVAATHLAMAVLSLIGRAAYSVPPKHELLAVVADNQMWTWLHALVGIAILVTTLLKQRVVVALAASTGVMGAWSLLSFLWGLQTARPVSLAGPLLGSAVVTLTYFLAMSYAVTHYRNHNHGHDVGR